MILATVFLPCYDTPANELLTEWPSASLLRISKAKQSADTGTRLLQRRRGDHFRASRVRHGLRAGSPGNGRSLCPPRLLLRRAVDRSHGKGICVAIVDDVAIIYLERTCVR